MSRRDRSEATSRKQTRRQRKASEDVRSHLIVDKIEDGYLFVKGEGPRIVLEVSACGCEWRAASSAPRQRRLLPMKPLSWPRCGARAGASRRPEANTVRHLA